MKLKYCHVCKQATPHEPAAKPINHPIHAVATFLTAGIWGLVWVVVILKHDKSINCLDCGLTTD